MSQTMRKDRKIILLSIVVTVTTVVAGIMHIMMAPRSFSEDLGEGILFLVGGVLQVFWAVPVIKQWGRIWQIIGIAGTAIFVILWFATHTHSLFGSTVGHIPEGVSQANTPPANVPQGSPQGNFTGEHFPRGPPPRGIASIPQIEYWQFAFIGLYATLSKMISKRQNRE